MDQIFRIRQTLSSPRQCDQRNTTRMLSRPNKYLFMDASLQHLETDPKHGT
jgi:hypothetical protein